MSTIYRRTKCILIPPISQSARAPKRDFSLQLTFFRQLDIKVPLMEDAILLIALRIWRLAHFVRASGGYLDDKLKNPHFKITREEKEEQDE